MQMAADAQGMGDRVGVYVMVAIIVMRTVAKLISSSLLVPSNAKASRRFPDCNLVLQITVTVMVMMLCRLTGFSWVGYICKVGLVRSYVFSQMMSTCKLQKCMAT